MDEKRQFWKGLLCGIGVSLLLALGAISFQRLQALKSDTSSVKTENTAEENTELDLTDSEISGKLEEMQELVNKYYLDEVDREEVVDSLYAGVMYGLGDVYAAYYTEDEYASMMDATNGSYCGIGAQFSQSMTTGIVTVSKVFKGNPAMEAGLLPGDILYKVDGEESTGQDLTKLVASIKGEEGTKVVLTIYRESKDEYIDIEVTRRVIEIQTVESEMLDEQIGYIAVSEFDTVTADQFDKAITELESQGMKSLIVDLRNNGGGVVSSVTAMLDRLLPEGLIVYTEDKNGSREEATSDAEHYFDKPLAVLVNGNSASASEIFAGAVKDYGIGTLVGTQTYGKGIVQKIFELSDGTAMKLTVSKYFTPNGNNIHGVGIEPDVVIDLTEELKTEVVVSHDVDNQLQKAIEVLQQ